MVKPMVKSYTSKEILELMGPAETQYAACNDVVQSGGNTPVTQTVEMGQTSGTFNFSWDMLSVQDRMIVRYGSTVLHDTGCVSGTGLVSLSYSGTSSQITVEVIPACAGGGTVWYFTVFCPTTPPTRR